MKEYSVEIPMNARIFVTVEAESEKEAIKKALEEMDLQLNPESEKGYEIDEWDTYEKMIEGNFFHGVCHRASAQEM